MEATGESGGAAARGDLTRGPITRTLLVFALPMLGSNILQSLNGSINAVWAGRFLGENAIAATANANLIQFVLFSLLFGFGMAAAVLIGQAYGRRDIVEARRVLGSAMALFFLIAVGIALLGFFLAPVMLRLLGTPPEVYVLARDYLRVIFIGMPPALLMVVLSMALRGAGDSVTPLFVMVLNVLLDAGLNPVFILGLGPAPRLGIAGAATATAIAGYGTFTALVALIYLRKQPLRLRGREFGFLWPEARLIRPILVKGLPMGLQMTVMSISGLAMMSFVDHTGALNVAAYGMIQQLWTYVQMPAIAIGAAASAMAAQNVGANQWDRVGRVTRSAVVSNILFSTAAILLLMAADRPILTLFVGHDSPAIPVAQHIYRIGSWSMVLLGVSTCLFGTMRATGVVLVPLAATFIGLFPVRLGFVYLAVPRFGLDMLWLSFTVGSAAVMLMAMVLYLRGGWRRGRMLAVPDTIEAEERSLADSEPGGRLYPTG
ncbi:MAG: MATE family efflux transporter [Sphingomonadaceae bacterium]|nr:MATE family efflux transporter [Sphingomonadaceae bacterium]